MLLCALSEAKDTVPLKSAFFRCGTGFYFSSKCFLASPKSTMYTCLLSLDRMKFDYIAHLLIQYTYSFDISMYEATLMHFFNRVKHFDLIVDYEYGLK